MVTLTLRAYGGLIGTSGLEDIVVCDATQACLGLAL